MEVGGGCAVAPPVANRHLHAGNAMLLCGVIIIIVGMAGLDSCFDIGVDERIFISRLAYRERAVPAAIEACASFPGLLPPKIGEHVGIGPARCTVRCPAIVVGAVAAHIGHGIDGGRAADNFAAHAFQAAVAGARIGLGIVTPVVAS